MSDDSWRDTYDAWKLASPYDDDLCDHDDYDVDILDGRAHCNRCPESWYVSEEEVARQIEHQAAYHEQLERENSRQWWRDLFSPATNLLWRFKKALRHREAIIDDDIPF